MSKQFGYLSSHTQSKALKGVLWSTVERQGNNEVLVSFINYEKHLTFV